MLNTDSIAFLCHPYHRGGVTRWMADAAIALSEQGQKVYFITISPVKEFFSAKGRETLLQLLGKSANTVKIISEPAGNEFEFGTPEYRAWIYKKLIVRLPQGTPVILSDDHAVWEAATCLHSNYPVVGVLHADENHYYDLAEKYHSKVDLFACVSERVKHIAIKRIPEYDPAKIVTIPCGIHLPAVMAAEKTNDTLKLVFVGRISEYQKRAGDLIKIAVLLEEKAVKFSLHIIGDGNLKPSLEKQVEEKGLQAHVKFPGWLSQQEVANYLSGSDILLLTSDFEGTPIAMMEALAAGCGMVGTRVSGIEDYENHSLAKDCLGVYQTGDIEGAITRIKIIAAIPHKIRQESARRMAETEFSMDVCLKRYLAAMHNLIWHPARMPAISLSSKQLLYSKIIAAARYMKIRFSMR